MIKTYRAIPISEITDEESLKELPRYIYRNGYVYGHLLPCSTQMYIVGELADVTADYALLDFWCPVIESTIEEVDE